MLCFFITGFFILSLALLIVLVFCQSCLWSPHLGKRQRVYMLCFFCTRYVVHFFFLLATGVSCHLRHTQDFSINCFFFFFKMSVWYTLDIMNDHGLEQLVYFPTREKHIDLNTHFSHWSVSGYSFTGRTQWSYYFGNFERYNSPLKKPRRNVYILLEKVIRNLLEGIHLNLQRKKQSKFFQC